VGESFETFVTEAAPRLQRAFVAAYGSERGHEAAAEALGYAWEHWKRIARMENPIGYLFRVGQSRTRPRKRVPLARMWTPTDTGGRDALVEPGLQDALAELSESQRVAVVLVHGYAWTLREVAELIDVSVSTVQTHLDRALAKLRAALEVVDDE
jgi:DNA-directed RNA polymerase specialized sigma24 family protein